MDPAQEELNKRIEDGSYFQHGRDWYNLMYIGPISERIFFIIITIIAAFIFVFAVSSVYNLLPIKPRIPFVYRAKDFIGEIPKMVRFKEPNEPSNPALIKYYLNLYTSMRESYEEDKYILQWMFVKNYSDKRTFREFERSTNPNNPRSPIRRFGKYADVKVKVSSVTYNRETLPYKGVVNFSTEVIGSEQQRRKTNWTATIGFEYTDLTETDYFDERLQDYVLNFEEPKFKVVSYDVRERLVTEGAR